MLVETKRDHWDQRPQRLAEVLFCPALLPITLGTSFWGGDLFLQLPVVLLLYEEKRDFNIHCCCCGFFIILSKKHFQERKEKMNNIDTGHISGEGKLEIPPSGLAPGAAGPGGFLLSSWQPQFTLALD